MVRLYALGIATLAVMWTTVMAAHIYFYLPPLPWITDMATTLVARAAGPLREGTLPAYFEQMRTYHLEMSVYDPSGHLITSGDKIAEDWVLVESLGFFQQLGAVPDTAELIAALARSPPSGSSA